MKLNVIVKLLLVLLAWMCCSNLSAQTTPPVPGGFATTGNMAAARNSHTATMLNDGTVLIAGGLAAYASGSGLNSAELYNPSTGVFTSIASPLNLGVFNHTATLLNDGKVLIAGGQLAWTPADATAQAEVFDPVTGAFTPTVGLTIPRQQHTATLLPNGKVLIVGGYSQSQGAVASAELYDPMAGTFTATGSLANARYGQTATLLNNGNVLIAGGYSAGELSSAELYDPIQQTFSSTTDAATGSTTTLNEPRFLHTATLLNSGQVLFTAGVNASSYPNPSSTAELFDPTTGDFRYTTDINGAQTFLNTARYFHSVSLGNNGMVLIAGGQIDGNGTPTPYTELYDPVAQTFTYTADINTNLTALGTARYDATSTLLTNGNVLIAGGVTSVIPVVFPTSLFATASAELYGPLTPNPLRPTISWATPASITYGTLLSGTQLNATAAVLGPLAVPSLPGTFAYSPALGSVLPAGNQTLSVTFTPTDATDYTTAMATVTLAVSQATPTISWATPAAMNYGTLLSSTQLNATASVPGAFAYSPAAGAVLPAGNQTLSMTFTPTDATDYTTATDSVTLVVNQAMPTISWVAPAAITYGTPLSSTQLNATASVPGNYVYSSAAGAVLPAGNQILSVTFTPTDTIDYTTATTSVTLTVIAVVNQPPTITSGGSITFVEGTPGSFTLTATGYPTPTLTEAGALPVGVLFTDNGNGTATLSGTPATGSGGTYSLTFTANNGVGAAAMQLFTLTVNAAARITSGSSTTFTVGSPGWFTVSAAGGPIPALSEIGSMPAGVIFVDNGNGTATLSGTPSVGSAGAYSITLSANNGVGAAATQIFTLMVNQGPAITSGSATIFTVGAAGSFLLTATGAPIPALTESGALPAGVTFTNNGNGTAMLSGTPAVGVGGVYPLILSATNSVATTTQSFTLTVVQGIAITSGSTTTFTVGSQGWFSVTATGFPVPALSETGNLPTGVTFADNGNGTATLTGTPAALTGGLYGITIKATNGGTTPDATQSFTLMVNQGAAIITGNSTTFTVGVQGTFTVTSTGDPTPALTEAGPLPIGVSFTDSGSGTGILTGTPVSGTAGTYPITINASNGVGSATIQSFTLTVNQGPAITSTNSVTFNELVAGSFTVTATGSPTPALTEEGNLPTGVTFVDNGNGSATLSGTPAAGTGGLYGFTIRASNAVVPDATQSFTLAVGQAAAITSANAATFIAGNAGSFTVTASGIPTPSLGESGALPNGVAFNAAMGVLSGTPGTGTGGVYKISFVAHNGVGADATQSFTLTVDQAPAITSSSSVKFGAGAYASFLATTTGFPKSALNDSGLLPSGVTLTDNGNGTATLAGTPATGSEGTYVITLTASNGVGLPAVQSFTLRVYGETGPVFTSPNHFTATAAGPLSPGGVQLTTFTVITTGSPIPKLICPQCGQAGTFRDNGDGTATWVFDAGGARIGGSGNIGTFPFSITATGAGGAAYPVVQVVSVTVVAPKLPAITSANHAVFNSGTLNNSFTVTTTGAPAPVIQATIGAGGVHPPQPLPSFQFTDNGNGTATLGGPYWSLGTYTIQITATGYGGAAHAVTQTFSLLVVGANESEPVFTSPNHFTAAAAGQFSPSGPVGPVQLTTFTVITTGSPIPKLICPQCGQAGTFRDNGDGTATWVFDAGGARIRGNIGTFPFSITATGAGGAAYPVVQVVSVTVVAPKLPAITSANHAVFTAGTFGSFTVTTTGSPAPVLTYHVTTTGGLGGLSFTDNGNGTATLSGSPCNFCYFGISPLPNPLSIQITATGYGGAAHAVTQMFNLLVAPPPQ
jgi:hypothetical protein